MFPISYSVSMNERAINIMFFTLPYHIFTSTDENLSDVLVNLVISSAILRDGDLVPVQCFSIVLTSCLCCSVPLSMSQENHYFFQYPLRNIEGN
jgi:hypothetical protein